MCDGVTDDTTAIQSALTALVDNAVLYFPAGNCITGKLSTPVGLNNVTLYGAGPASQLQRKTGIAAGAPGFFNLLSCTKCEIASLTLINDPAVQLATLYGDETLNIQQCTGVTARDLYISQGYATGILVYASANTTVDSCYIYGYADDVANATAAVAITYGIGVIDNSTGTIIVNNQLSKGAVGIACQQVNTGGAISDTIIDNNMLTDMAGYGIMLYNLGIGVFRSTIVGNFVSRVYGSATNAATSSRSFGAGIYTAGAKDFTITGNTVEYTNLLTDSQVLAPACIGLNTASSFTVTGNTLRQYAAINYPCIFAISVFAATNEGSRTISSNTLEDCAIWLTASFDIEVSGNAVKTSKGFASIWLQNTTDSQVTGNSIQAATTTIAGILDDGNCARNLFSNNRIRGLNTSLTQGVAVTGSDTDINGNYIYGGLRALNIGGSSNAVINNIGIANTNCFALSITTPRIIAGNYGQPISASSTVYLGTTAPFTQSITGTTIVTVNSAMRYASIDCGAGTRTVTAMGGGYAGQLITFVPTNGVGVNFTLPSTSMTLPTSPGYLFLAVSSGASATFMRLDTAPTGMWVLTSYVT